MNIKDITQLGTQALGRSGLVLQHHSPKILTYAGIAGIIGAGVLTVRATLKLEETTSKVENRISTVKDLKAMADENNDDSYDKQYVKDLTAAYTRSAIDYARLYGPAVLLTGASIAAILGGHNILEKRNVALVAAYKAVDTAFTDYRKRVIDELGVEKEEEIRMNVVATTESTDLEGNKVVLKHVKPGEPSMYARWFDETTSASWSAAPWYNLGWLRTQQAFANDRLRARGYLFLNEVYASLGLTATSAGAIVGWVLSEDGDNVVDFGIYNGDTEAKRMFVNGDNEVNILLDFNVDGPIWEYVDQVVGAEKAFREINV
jgi:hypothetical protein